MNSKGRKRNVRGTKSGGGDTERLEQKKGRERGKGKGEERENMSSRRKERRKRSTRENVLSSQVTCGAAAVNEVRGGTHATARFAFAARPAFLLRSRGADAIDAADKGASSSAP